jgi:hypothetical protein
MEHLVMKEFRNLRMQNVGAAGTFFHPVRDEELGRKGE